MSNGDQKDCLSIKVICTLSFTFSQQNLNDLKKNNITVNNKCTYSDEVE